MRDWLGFLGWMLNQIDVVRPTLKMAQKEGFEPPTNRLTADCSTTELLLNKL